MDILHTGIDVAKAELVVCVDGRRPFVVPNTPEGCAGLLPLLPPGGSVHLESSGGYERLVCRILGEAGVRVLPHDPLKARRLAQALGVRAKTDGVDAAMLSRSGSILPEPAPKDPARRLLGDHSRAVDALKDAAADFDRRAGSPELDAAAKGIYEAAAEGLRARAAEAERAFAARAAQSRWAGWIRLVRSVPGLGPVAARVLVAELPEDLASRSGSQVASYAGLAPVDRSSGTWTGPSRLGRGNASLKRAFYMPALSAVRSQGWARDLYARLRAKGKAHQSAIAAVMRRLLLRAVAVLKRGTPWEERPGNA